MYAGKHKSKIADAGQDSNKRFLFKQVKFQNFGSADFDDYLLVEKVNI
jgi:hypothetical protein